MIDSGESIDKVEYVIFDMDGLLIDSERIYTDVTNIILSKYGKEMTWDIKAGLMGKPEREASEHLLSFFPDIPLTVEEYMKERDILQDALWPTVQPLPGVIRLVKHLHNHNIPIAIATGSRRRNLLLKTGHLQDLVDCFQDKIVCADDGLVKLGRGKPCPDTFIAAAGLLNRKVGPNEETNINEEVMERAKGLVFEDAIPGIEAGKRAGMKVVWIPDTKLLEVEYSGLYKANETLRSLTEFVPAKYGLPPYRDE